MSRLARTLVITVITVVLASGTAGCASLPDSGPIVEAQVPVAADNSRASDFDPVPPSPDESPAQIAAGFLDAMTASPIRTDVAREYLTSAAAAAWAPGDSTITYNSKQAPVVAGSEVTVELVNANRLDASGTWRGPVRPAAQDLRFRVVADAEGQYRIDDPPDALIVPDTWFTQRFRQASLYFFDTTGRILVPQPVFVPLGDQFATSLLTALLAPLAASLRTTVRTYLGESLSTNLSVLVSPDGVADIALKGPAGRLGGDAVAHILAQLAFTLRQDPDLTGLTLSIGGDDVLLPGGEDVYSFDQATSFDPTVAGASTRMFGLQNGRLVTAPGAGTATATAADVEATDGPLGTTTHALRSVAVSLDGTTAAAVTADGHGVLEATAGSPVSTDPDRDPPQAVKPDHSPPRRVVSGAVDLLPPAWDFSGRVWFVDRRKGAARVSYIDDGGSRQVLVVPGISGTDVGSFLVSRDGTRLVAVVHGAAGDTLRVSRIQVDVRGDVVGAGPATVIDGSSTDPMRAKDIAWTSATTIGVLTPIVPGTVFEIRTVSVDGSPTDVDSLATPVSGSVVGLAASPNPDETPYAVTRTGLIDLTTSRSLAFAPTARPLSLDYVG